MIVLHTFCQLSSSCHRSGFGFGLTVVVWLLGAGAVRAGVPSSSSIAMLSEYTALRFCAYRLDGLSTQESEAAALADLEGHYHALIKNQADAVRAALPSLARQHCPEIYSPKTKSKTVVQPPAFRRDVSTCTPSMAEAHAVSAGRPLSLKTLDCQIRFNMPPF